jgi:hypothetical protein
MKEIIKKERNKKKQILIQADKKVTNSLKPQWRLVIYDLLFIEEEFIFYEPVYNL